MTSLFSLCLSLFSEKSFNRKDHLGSFSIIIRKSKKKNHKNLFLFREQKTLSIAEVLIRIDEARTKKGDVRRKELKYF